MNNFFEYKDCFTPLREIGVIPIFENKLDNCRYTIAIPTYKRPADLVLAIESALQQDYKPYNIIIVDNNPERGDETEIIVKERFCDNGNLSYYKNMSNVGMIKNWNRLFELSNTEYVVMLHDDDYLFPYFLNLIDQMINKEGDISAINAGKEMWDGSMPSVLQLGNGMSSIKVYDYSSYSNYPFFHFGAPSGCVFRREDVYKEGGFDDSVYPSSDYIFIQKMCMAGKKMLRTKDSLMLYRVGLNTSSKLETDLQWIEMEAEIKRQLSALLNIRPLYQRIVAYFDIKIRVRRIEKQLPGYRYKDWTRGGKIFLVFYNIYKIICSSLIRVRRITL